MPSYEQVSPRGATEIGGAVNRCATTGKVRYGHMETAVKAAEKMKLRGCGSMEPYNCRWCGAWHIGHGQRSATVLLGKLRLLKQIKVSFNLLK